MRNLAGRLNNRSLPSLMSIADEWKIPVSAKEKHSLVGEVYRGMRDLRAARDEWEALDQRERQAVRLLAVSKEAPSLSVTIHELAAMLGQEFDDTWEVAASLYRKGIIARESDDDEIPIGESPRIFLPRELAILFRRIQDEIDAGDLSRTNVEALLALLDDAEIEQAVAIWGRKPPPGMQRREEMVAFLLQSMANPAVRGAVIAKQSSDAQAVLRQVENADDRLVSLDEAFATVTLPNASRAKAVACRTILAGLESSLLVWHAYPKPDERRLFVPVAVDPIVEPSMIPLEAPEPIAAEHLRVLRAATPYTVTWDQLTLLRAFAPPKSVNITSIGNAPAAWLTQINRKLWFPQASTDEIETYLNFLVTLARSESVIEGGNRDRTDLDLGPGWSYWRDLSFREQASRLLWFWISHQQWVERPAQPDVIAEEILWPQLRKRLLVRLAEIPTGKWFLLQPISRWLASKDTEIVDTKAWLARSAAGENIGSESEKRALAIEMLLSSLISSSFSWFGFVETGRDPKGRLAFRTTEFLSSFSRSEPLPEFPIPAGPPLVVSDTCAVTLRAPSPLRIWSLSAFAEQTVLRPEAHYQITADSLGNALKAGFRVEDVVQFLEKQCGTSLNERQRGFLNEKAGTFRRVFVAPQFLLSADNAADLEAMRRLIAEAGIAHTVSGSELIVTCAADESADHLHQRLITLFQQNGLSPFRGGTGTATNVDKQAEANGSADSSDESTN